MLARTCTLCPDDTSLSTSLRQCLQLPHYSDYSQTNNYNLDGAASLPIPDPKLTPCPPKNPFWNGTCISCKNGKWWSVKDSVCKSCPVGQAFDPNTRSCVAPSGKPSLTVLEGTQWVTAPGNFTNVLKERAKLAENGTQKLMHCSADSPYFDGFQCINCDAQFDLTALKCTQAPTGSAYDDNLHAFLPQETNKETNTKAQNILSAKPLINSTVPDCNTTAPFFDGIACILCPEPFPLFDVVAKQCTACNAEEAYNSISLKC